MALPTSGTITLDEIHIEAGGTTGTLATINDVDIRALIGKAAGVEMSFDEWYAVAPPQSYTVTEASDIFASTSYYGLRNGGTVGSASPTNITVAGNSHVIKDSFRRCTSSGGIDDDTTSAFYFGLYYTAADDQPADNWFTSLDIDATGGTINIPQSTASVFSTGSGATGYKEWRWFSSDFTAQELIDLSSQWDGSGTSDVTINE